MLSRYASVAGALSIFINMTSLSPVIIFGPITSLIHIFTSLANPNESLATKIVNIFTGTSSTSISIAEIALQSIALPLAITGASLGVVREGWALIQ